MGRRARRSGHRRRAGALLAGLTAAATLLATVVTLGAGAAPAGAALPFPTVAPYGVPAPPASNIAFAPPRVCSLRPTGAACENAAVADLDRARRAVGLAPYRLPANFVHEVPIRQSFILTNLDRVAYGEPPFAGVNSTLRAWSGAVTSEAPATDPQPLGAYNGAVPWYSYGGNAAAGYPNILFAYEAWMYDDGPGSPNVDCPAPGAQGCWGHRTNILRDYRVCVVNGPSDSQCTGGYWAYLADLSYGAATGRTSGGQSAYDQLFTGGPSLLPYNYTWSQAVAAGAGRHLFRVPTALKLSVVAMRPVGMLGGRRVFVVVMRARVAPGPRLATRVRFGGAASPCRRRHVDLATATATCRVRIANFSHRHVSATFLGSAVLARSSARRPLRAP